MIDKSLEKIILEDIEKLISDSVAESKTLEFKKELKISSDKDRREFLADISALANTIGGDLIFGIEENKNGEAKSIIGLNIERIEEEIIRLENIIRDGIEPRIIGIQPYHLKLDENRYIIILRIPNSWISPHRVIFKGYDKFFGRSSKSKYPLDVNELKVAFNLSENLDKNVQTFFRDRISIIESNETPIQLEGQHKVITHIIPLSAFSIRTSYDLSKIDELTIKLKPMHVSSWNHQANFEGFITYGMGNSYLQFFNNGIIEAVSSNLISKDKGIPSTGLVKELVKSTTRYINLLKELNVGLPLIVYVTLINCQGLKFHCNQDLILEPITHNKYVLRLNESYIYNFDDNNEEIYRKIFNSMWNAYGYEKCEIPSF